MEIIFNNSFYLLFLIGIPLLIIIHFMTIRSSKKVALKFANFEAISRATGTPFFTRNLSLLLVRILIILLIVLSVSESILVYTGRSNDYDIIIAIDASASMSATDYNPNRLEAAKKQAVNFVNSLSYQTNIGVLSFSGASFIEQPMTNDMFKVRSAIKNIQIKTIGGTDLAEAITVATNMLMGGEKAKLIILLTDGQSNVGISLDEALDYTNQNQVAIHTIGMGTEEGAAIGGIEAISKLNEDILRSIALRTEGVYYRALTEESIAKAYENIASSTEKKISTNIAPAFLLAALVLLFIEWILANTKYRIIP